MNLKQLLAMGCFAIAPYTSWAQGIIVHKTDGSEVRFKATEVERITTYSEEEEPNLPKDVTIQVGDVGLRMIYVEGGVFTMGGTDEQGEDVKAYEEPAHPVKLNSYYIGMTEVTQELWETVMGWNYAWNTESNQLPMEDVSWEDCNEFAEVLSERTGKKFRLPTEAEWEYAARGGIKSGNHKYSGSDNIDDVAWYGSNSDDMTHEVGTKNANELGIYDMNGNVWEWCHDWYGEYSTSSYDNPTGPKTGDFRIYRGGSYKEKAEYNRTSNRSFNRPDFRYGNIGLRVVMEVEE